MGILSGSSFSVLLHSYTTRTLTKRLVKKIDATFSKMLRAVLNKFQKEHSIKQQMYRHLTPISQTI